MGAMSLLRPCAAFSGQVFLSRCFHTAQRTMGHDRKMFITPSRWQWHKFKDMLHFYVMVGAIPLGLVTLYANIFIGPAKLQPIPEGYWPEEQEYYSHPITRFIVRWIYRTYQENYEKKLHVMFVEDEIRQMNLLQNRIKEVIRKRQDVQGYSFVPVLSKYHKAVREEYENVKHEFGDSK